MAAARRRSISACWPPASVTAHDPWVYYRDVLTGGAWKIARVAWLKQLRKEDCGEAAYINRQNLRTPTGRGVASGFRADKNGNQTQKIRPGATHGGAMLKWLDERAWIGSRLIAYRKCRLLLQKGIFCENQCLRPSFGLRFVVHDHNAVEVRLAGGSCGRSGKTALALGLHPAVCRNSGQGGTPFPARRRRLA